MPHRTASTSITYVFLLFAVALFCIAILILSSLLLYNVLILPVPPELPVGVESAACSDLNDCTLDLLVAEYGHSACVNRNLPNGGTCKNACYSSPSCHEGQCVGVCKGNCNISAFDCPVICVTDLTALGFGRDAGDEIKLLKTCLLNTCFYTIELTIQNATFEEGVVPEIEKMIDWMGSTTTSNNTQPEVFQSADHKMSEIVCMGFIVEKDRGCIEPMSLVISLSDNTEPQLTLTCAYVFGCTDPPPATKGSIPFPASPA